MKRNHLLPVAILLLSAAFLPGQEGVRQLPPLYRGPNTEVQGVFVTPVAGLPFSATVQIESEQTLPDGTRETRHTQVLIARDSRGRIRNERHLMVPETFHGTPPLLSVHIFDPETRISSFYNMGTRIVRQQTLPPMRDGRLNDPHAEDLGYTTLNGMQARGSRVTRIVPSWQSGVEKPVHVVDEFWYSEDLHMNLLEQHTDVRNGVQTIAILSIQRDEPPAALFEMPEGYKIVDMTPPPEPPTAQAGAAAGGPTR
jgi:hypothetical protein